MINTSINLYGSMLLLAIISNVVVIIILSKKYSFSKMEVVSMLIYENIGIVTGGKIFTYITNYKEYNGQFDFLQLGFSSYGGLIGALLFLILFSFQFKKNLKVILYIFMTPIPLIYSIGKIGCFLVGCCHGIEYSGIGSVTYNYSRVVSSNVSFFPVQILETIAFLLIFIYLFCKNVKGKFNIKILGIGFILSGIAKFFLDFFRISHIGKIFSLNQIISLLFIIIGLYLCLKNKIKKEGEM
jgi:phosphatidylglycerol:prolipoprotein diacylglycerol transferase